MQSEAGKVSNGRVVHCCLLDAFTALLSVLYLMLCRRFCTPGTLCFGLVQVR